MLAPKSLLISIADGTYDRIKEEGTAGDERLW